MMGTERTCVTVITELLDALLETLDLGVCSAVQLGRDTQETVLFRFMTLRRDYNRPPGHVRDHLMCRSIDAEGKC